jgi:hypothetical protein
MMAKKKGEQVKRVERWGIFELVLDGPAKGNPFVDVNLAAEFRQGKRILRPEGFYDGKGVYKVRFSPDTEGLWQYVTKSNVRALGGKKGEFVCVAAKKGNHGPVLVSNSMQIIHADDTGSSAVNNPFHFAYGDGKPYVQMGTTCYAWTHQTEALERQTLATLKKSPFNKIRMCVFPKRYSRNENEPRYYPFEGKPLNKWDFTRFNPVCFSHFEKRVADLMKLGIEADVILFHPYDRGHWGFDRMGKANDDRYLRYVIARLAAYRNVWWSLANEYDFMREKKESDWDRFGKIVQKYDPYRRLCSIHNGSRIYDHNKPWITHVSIQNGSAVEDFGRAILYRDIYRKPVVFDEVKYEGNIEQRWGNLTAEEMVLRFWHGTIDGTYVGHGETYRHPNDILWWAKGGVLHGKSPARIKFLKKMIESSPTSYVEPLDKWQYQKMAGIKHKFYIVYFGREKVKEWQFCIPRGGMEMPAGSKFKVELIDTWRMTIKPLRGVFETKKKDRYCYCAKKGGKIRLPGRPYMALRIIRVD